MADHPPFSSDLARFSDASTLDPAAAICGHCGKPARFVLWDENPGVQIGVKNAKTGTPMCLEQILSYAAIGHRYVHNEVCERLASAGYDWAGDWIRPLRWPDDAQ